MPYSFNPFTGNFDNTPSTLKGDIAYTNVNANSASYATIDFTNSKFFPLTGGQITGNTRINGDVTIFGNLTSTGTQTFANTIFSTTSSLSVVHVGSGPAVWIGNNGSGDIASFYDMDQGVEVFHVGGANGDFPNVGVKTSSPNKDFTIKGELSASSDIWTSGRILSGGQELASIFRPDIDKGLSVFNTVQSNSATNWNYQGTDIKALTSSWVGGNSVYSNVRAASANYILDGGNTKGSNLLIGTNDNFNLALETSGVSRLTILSSGSVGINETSPEGRLHVTAGSAGSVVAQTSSVGVFESGGNAYLSLLSPTSHYAGVVMGGPTNAYGSYVSWNHDNLALKVATNHAGASIQMLAGTEQEAMRVASTGNIGIGTTSPSEKLTVSGNISASGNLYGNASLLTNVIDSGVRALTGNYTSVYSNVNSASANWQNTYTNFSANSASYATSNFVQSNFLPLTGGIISGTLEAGTGSVTLFISGNRIGINTELPNEALTVVGNISSTGIYYGDGSNLTGVSLPGQAELNTVVQTNSASWNYQGTDIKSLTSDWVGGNAAFTNLISNSAAYLSSVNLSFLSVSANWNSVYSTVLANSATNWNYQGTDLKDLSANWQSTLTTVSSNSAKWESVYSSVAANSASYATINFVDDKFLPLSGGAIQGSIVTTGGVSIGDELETATLFVSSGHVGINTELPNEALTVIGNVSSTGIVYSDNGNSNQWNSVYSNVNANSATYATIDFANNKFFALSGGLISGATRINGNVTIFGDLSSTGTQTFANTIFATTSSLSVVHVGSGPAVWVGNNGSGDIASFYDIDQGVEVFHIGGANGDFPNVGVKTSSPNKDFTVNGEISATGDIWTSGRILSGGQELLSLIQPSIENVYNTVNANSAVNWNYQGADLKALSGSWQGTYTNYSTSSASYATSNFVQSNFLPLSGGNVNGVFEAGSGSVTLFVSSGIVGINTEFPNHSLTVVGNISSSSIIYSDNGNSNQWNSVYTTVQAKSATEWDNALANSYARSNFLPLSGGTVSGSISASGVISASASNIKINVVNNSSNRIFTNADNNTVVHIDTTTTPLCAIFPSSLSDGFNVAIMNVGTNNLVLSAASLKSAGTIITTQYGGAFVYKDSSNLFAVGRLA